MIKHIRLFGKQYKISHIVLLIVMTIIAFVMIAPFLWVFSASLRPYNQAISLPPKWLPPAFSNWNMNYFKKLFSDSIPFLTFMGNSLKMSTVITIGMVIHGTIAGYAYAKFKFPFKNTMFFLMMIAMMVPIQVTIVSLYRIMHYLGVLNTSLAVTLPSIFGAMSPGLAGAFGIFMMRQYFLTIPKELNEAATIDGAGPIKTFIFVMLPMAKSMIISLAIIVFTYSWNDYFTTFIMINDNSKLSLPVGILSIRQPFATGDNVEFAAVVLSVIPVLIVFILGQKWIVKSISHVGVKG
jgi:multiple sugar transport system permease protein